MTNPYQAPDLLKNAGPLPENDKPNACAWGGLGVNLVALLCLMLVGRGGLLDVVGQFGAFLALPGLALCLLGLFHPARRLAIWGILVGIYVCLYLPTIAFAIYLWVR